MRTVTELGFTASAFPERAAVQEAPGEGKSFFDTLSKAGESAQNTENVTDDKPETAGGDDRAAETNTKKAESEEETSAISGEAEKEEPTEDNSDIMAQMMALGRMIEIVQPEQQMQTEVVESTPSVIGEIGGEMGETETLMTQMLTPVENSETTVMAPAESVAAAVTAENFADAMTHTLKQALETQGEAETVQPEQPMMQPEFVQTQAQPTEDAAILSEAAEVLQPIAEETAEGETQEIPELELSAEISADMETAQVVENAQSAENTDFSQSFSDEERSFAGGEKQQAESVGTKVESVKTETDDGLTVETETAETPIADLASAQQTLRSRFSLNDAVQQVDNTELAQAIEKAIDRFAEDFRIAEVDVQQITIRLDPEELGSMSITVAAENNVLTAKIVTDNKEAASLLSAQIEQFLEAMEQKGIKVEKAEVTYNSQLDLGGQAANEHSGGARSGRQAISGISAVEMVEAEEAAKLDETAAAAAVAAVKDEATNYYVFDDKYVPNHVYKV